MAEELQEVETKTPQAPWYQVIALTSHEEEDFAGMIARELPAVHDSLGSAPEEITLHLQFENEHYDAEDVRKCVNQWLNTALQPWVVVGTDKIGRHCAVMLAGRSIYEVMYGA